MDRPILLALQEQFRMLFLSSVTETAHLFLSIKLTNPGAKTALKLPTAFPPKAP